MPEIVAGFEQAVEPITWVLVHFIWQAALVAGGLGIVLRLMSGRGPMARYRCACWALLLVVVMPLVTLGVVAGSGAVDTQETIMRIDARTASASSPEHPIGEAAPTGIDVDRVLAVVRWTVFTTWLIGVFALSWIHLVGWWRVRKLKLRDVGAVAAVWQDRADAIARRLGFDRAVNVLSSALAEVPMVIGCFRPVIVLPVSALTGLETGQVEAILAHELAHIWRRDAVVNMLQVVAETVLFYHPAVWWISGRIRAERELCCDESAVSVTGDRLTLARALLRLEELRRPVFHLAPAATGGSLRHRINRLLGGKTMSRQHAPFPLLGATLVVSILAVVGVAWAAVATNATPFQNVPAAAIGSGPAVFHAPEASGWSGASVAGQVSGTWARVSRGDHTRLQLRRDTGHGKSTISLDLSAAEEASVLSAIGGFDVHREAGVFQFNGATSAGGGSFVFSPDADFFRDLESYGITGLDIHEKFVIAAVGVDRRWVSELVDLGYGDDLDGETLVALGIHRVTPEYVRELASVGVDGLDLEEVLAMRIHGVDAEWVEEMIAAGFDVDGEELLAWKIHGIDAEFIESLAAAGFGDLDAEEILAMRIHGVSEMWLEKMRAAGLLEDIDAEEALAMKIHGVTPTFIDELDRLGYHEVNAEGLVAMRIHGVGPDFIEELEGLGYSHVDVEELVAMKIHNVSAEFIEEQQLEYGREISIEDLIDHKIMGHYHRH